MEISYHLIYILTSGKGGRYVVLQVYSDCLPSIISLLISPVILWLLSEKFPLSHYQKGILGGILLFSDLKSGQSFANRILWRECTGHIKLPFQQHKRRLYTWTSPDSLYQNQIDYILCSKELYSQQKQDLELTVAQIMSSLLPNSDLNCRKWGKPLDHSGMT